MEITVTSRCWRMRRTCHYTDPGDLDLFGTQNLMQVRFYWIVSHSTTVEF